MVRTILESLVPRSSRLTFRIATVGALAAALALGACGRKGALDPPPGSSMQAPASTQSGTGEVSGQAGAQATEFGQDGKPIAPRGQKKRLPGDFLID